MENCFRYHKNRYFIQLKQIPLFAQKRLFPIWGTLFIFWMIPAATEAPSTSFLFIIANYEFYFLLFIIYFAQYFSQKCQSLPIITIFLTLQNLPFKPLKSLFSPSNHPYPAHFPLPKISRNALLYPLLHTPTNHLSFHQKYLKMA